MIIAIPATPGNLTWQTHTVIYVTGGRNSLYYV